MKSPKLRAALKKFSRLTMREAESIEGPKRNEHIATVREYLRSTKFAARMGLVGLEDVEAAMMISNPLQRLRHLQRRFLMRFAEFKRSFLGYHVSDAELLACIDDIDPALLQPGIPHDETDDNQGEAN